MPLQNAHETVDVHQLHLPKSYLRYLPAMLDGAKLMAADEQCVQFLAGDLNIDRSTLAHPVFRYQCRDSNGMTYRWYIDGDSLEVIDDTRPEGRISFAMLAAERERERELARQRAAEREAKIAAIQLERQQVAEQLEAERIEREQLEAEQREKARQRRLWQLCKTQLAEQTAAMIEREWLTKTQPAVEVNEQGPRYQIDFNARNLNGVALEYRAYCYVQTEGDTVTISIHPRALELESSSELAPALESQPSTSSSASSQ